jgi:hypothetical protein
MWSYYIFRCSPGPVGRRRKTALLRAVFGVVPHTPVQGVSPAAHKTIAAEAGTSVRTKRPSNHVSNEVELPEHMKSK